VAQADLSTDERAAVVCEAVACFRSALERPSVSALLSGGARLHEVPFSMRRGATVVHGTIDTLVRLDNRVVVVEFKTGAPAPAHRRQLDAYLDAARSLFSGCAVAGVLVYPDQDVWIAPSDLSRDDTPAGCDETRA
jgi:ATP-dependent exoDNAse (exonuclease V) beta subunit